MMWHSKNNNEEMVFSCPVCGYEDVETTKMLDREEKKPCDDCVDYDDWHGGCKWCKEHEYGLHRTKADAFLPTPVVTNYDQIINKTPEELAEWLSDVAGWLSAYEGKVHPILKWLKSPAEDQS
jgi:hypothetical protein